MNRTKRNIQIIAIFLIVVLVICTFVGRALYTSRMPQVIAAQAERGRLNFTAITEATIVYTDMVSIIADMDFLVEEVFFEIGNPIREGEPLLRINMERYEELFTKNALERQRLENIIWDLDEEIGVGYGGTQRLVMERDAYALELEVLLYASYGSQILYHGIEHNGELIDGVILSPTFGRVADYAQRGQVVMEGEELFLIVPNDTDTQIVWYMNEDEAVHFQDSMSAYFTYLTGTRRVEEFVSSRSVSRRWDGRLQLFRYSFPYDTIHRNLFGVTGELVLIHETSYFDTTVPASAIFFDQFGIPSVYILRTRNGLFGPEKYVSAINVNLLEISPDKAGIASILIRAGTYVICTWEDGELFDGVAVWAENLGVEAFDILGD
jgi:hypothetical protein